MDLNEYQEKAHRTALYPRQPFIYIENQLDVIHFPLYPFLKLNGESGEVSEKIGKLIRDQNSYIPESIDFPLSPILDSKGEEIKFKIGVSDIVKELGDILWYISEIANNMGLTLEYIASSNIEKLADRANRGVIHGSGDNR